MVLGSLGNGKSTLLNRMSGQPEDVFVAAMQTTGCTQEPKALSFDTLNLIDTPGLNDPNILTAEWAQRVNEWAGK